MVVLRGPIDFQAAYVQSKPDGQAQHRLHPARIERSFAIATKEVTMAQFAAFQGRSSLPESDLVQSGVSWYEAARYCNWLSREEGIAEDQWCYKVVQNGTEEILEVVDNVDERIGYRLPTEIEWDYACRAGSVTPRFYGNSPDLLHQYAWYAKNSNEHRHPPGLLKPNDLGLFDVYGNLWEWCQDRYSRPPKVAVGKSVAPQIAVRGGPFTGRPWYMMSSWKTSGFAPVQNDGIGFRVSRTILTSLGTNSLRTFSQPENPLEDSLGVARSGTYSCTSWLQQTGQRVSRYVHDPDGRTGFRVARTVPRSQ
jgi:formylglycine-generating enzyme required for sulfatase activity